MQKRQMYIDTQNKIIETTLVLMKTKPINSIKVTEIVRMAKINRTTFYLHFQDVPALIDFIENTLIDDLIECFKSVPVDWIQTYNQTQEEQFYLEFAQLIEANFNTYQRLMSSNGDAKFISLMRQRLSDYITPTIITTNDDLNISGDILHELILSGLLDILQYWIQKEPSLTPQKIARLLLVSRHVSPNQRVKENL
ncbi:TetR/AcrR family transcriptional regulator [Paucilactobacillus nenjiangensis]|uniref:TetR/AcrR family transcriptional regulator n=1 Tax=Paucilactobacillus nenjiangensis TaxID=1296540 RepID=UPI0010F6CD23|nr:TetR/AcrR family transcriptional regulator [Paucilactobacillus nenjiangensis]